MLKCSGVQLLGSSLSEGFLHDLLYSYDIKYQLYAKDSQIDIVSFNLALELNPYTQLQMAT